MPHEFPPECPSKSVKNKREFIHVWTTGSFVLYTEVLNEEMSAATATAMEGKVDDDNNNYSRSPVYTSKTTGFDASGKRLTFLFSLTG